jgi:hypothetical protein
MPIADSAEHTPAIAVTLRRPPGAGATQAQLIAAGSPALAGRGEVLQPHPRAVPVSNDRISLEGELRGGSPGRTRGGGGGGRGRRFYGGGRGGRGGREGRGGRGGRTSESATAETGVGGGAGGGGGAEEGVAAA